MRAHLPHLLTLAAAATGFSLAACDPDVFGDIDTWDLQYHLTVWNTVEGTLPDSFRVWTASVLRIVGSDTSTSGTPQPIMPNGAVRFDLWPYEWSETDTALVCLEVPAPCSVVGDTAQATQLAAGADRQVLFSVACQ